MNDSFELVLSDAAYCGRVGEIVRLLEPYAETDSVVILGQLLTAFGNIIGRRPHFRVEDDYHALNLYTLFVHDRQLGFTENVWYYTYYILCGLDDAWEDMVTDTGHLLWELEMRADAQIEPQRQHGIVGQRLLLYSDFANDLQRIVKTGRVLSALIVRAWNGGTVHLLTEKGRIRVIDLHLSILGHITRADWLTYVPGLVPPFIIGDITRKDLLASLPMVSPGFANRFIYLRVAHPNISSKYKYPASEDIRELRRLFSQPYHFARQQDDIGMDEEAARLWEVVYESFSERGEELDDRLTARAEAQVRRLACLYALLNCSPVVRLEHLRAALALWNYAEDSVRYILGAG